MLRKKDERLGVLWSLKEVSPCINSTPSSHSLDGVLPKASRLTSVLNSLVSRLQARRKICTF